MVFGGDGMGVEMVLEPVGERELGVSPDLRRIRVYDFLRT